MDGFKEIKNNKFEIKEHKAVATTDNRGNEDVFDKVTKSTHEFITKEDYKEGRIWTLDDLISENREQRVREGMTRTDEIKPEDWDEYAKILEEKNSKYSAKDRTKHLNNYKEIYNKKIGRVFFENIMAGNRPWKERIQSEKEYIELTAEAREEFLKAKMVDEKELEMDILINKVRKYYRLVRMYVSHARDEHLTQKESEAIEKARVKAQAKLEDYLKKIHKSDNKYKWKFSYESMRGGQIEEKAIRVEEKKIMLARPISPKEQEKIKKQQEEIKKDKNRKRISGPQLHYFYTGKWDPKIKKDKAGVNVEKKEGWVLSDNEKWVNEVLFAQEFVSDEHFMKTCDKLNEVYLSNLKMLDDVEAEENEDEERRKVELALKDKIDEDVKKKLDNRKKLYLERNEQDKQSRIEPLKTKLASNEQKIAKVTKKIEKASKVVGECENELKQLEKALGTKKVTGNAQLKAQVEEKISQLKAQIDENKKKIDDGNKDIATFYARHDEIKERIKIIENEDPKYQEPTEKDIALHKSTSKCTLVKDELDRMHKEGIDSQGRLTNKKLQSNFLHQLRSQYEEYKEKAKDFRIASAYDAEYNSIVRVVNLNIPEINNQIRKFYRQRLKNDGFLASEGGITTLMVMDNMFRDADDLKEFEFIKQYAQRYERLDEEIGLIKRGPDILKSKAIRDLITGKIEISEKDWDELKTQTSGVDQLVKEMVESKFSPISSPEIYRDVISFIGDKALFADYRTVRDLTERYLRGIALTNRGAASAENDFNEAYLDSKVGMFGHALKKASAVFLSRCYYSWNETDTKGNVKNRRKNMTKRLILVKRFNDRLEEKSQKLSLTKKGWDLFIDEAQKCLSYRFSGEPTPENKEDNELLIKKIDNFLDKGLIPYVLKKDKENNADNPTLSREEFFTGSKWSKQEKAEVISLEDFSYGGLFRGKGLLESKEVADLIPDEKLRKFLGDNLDTIVLNNKEMQEKFPFLVNIKGMDQLDSLTFAEFSRVLAHIKENLLSGDTQEGIRNLLADSTNDKATGEVKNFVEMRKYVLLEVMRKKTDKKGIQELIQKELKRQNDQEDLQRKRFQINIAKSSEKRDGKIKFRFEDMPDLDKTLLKKWFGKGDDWLQKRFARFEMAQKLWDELDKTKPELSAKLKGWFNEILSSDIKDEEKIDQFNALGCVIDGTVFKKGLVFKNTISTMVNISTSEVDELQEIIERLQPTEYLKNFDKSGAKDARINDKENKPSAKDFLLEMALFGMQDIMLGHGGIGQKALFTYASVGKLWEKDAAYSIALLQQAKHVNQRMNLLEKDLEPYKAKPELYKHLKDKLARYYIEMNIDEKQKKDDAEALIKGKTIFKEMMEEEEQKRKIASIEKRKKRDKYKMILETEKLSKDEIKEYERKIKELDEELSEADKGILEKKEQVDSSKKDLENIQLMIAGASQGLMEEYQKNSAKYGVGTISQLSYMLGANVSKDGVLSDELVDMYELYQSRKELVENYGDGELAPLFDELEKNDDFLKALLDPAQSVALEKIKSLHEKLSGLGIAMSEQFGYVSAYFAETMIPKLLNENDIDGQAILNKLVGKDKKEQVKIWNKELLDFRNLYITSTKKDTQSVKANMNEAKEVLMEALSKHYLKTAHDLDRQVAANEKKKFLGIYDFYGKKKDDIAKTYSESVIASFEYYLENDVTNIQKAYDIGTLKQFYKDKAAEFIENDNLAEKRFIAYCMEHEFGIAPPKQEMFGSSEYDDETVKKTLDGLSEHDRAVFYERISAFKRNIQNEAIATDSEAFAKSIDKRVKEFITQTKEALAADVSFTEQFMSEARKRIDDRINESRTVQIQKNNGKSLFDERLFGKKLDAISQFAQAKQSLAYVSKSGKNTNKVASLGLEKDKEVYKEAKAMFKATDNDKTAYPDFLAEVLDEYVRMHSSTLQKLDRFADWVIREKSTVQQEADRLKEIYKYGKDTAKIPEEAMNLYITYVARFADNATEISYKSASNEFLDFYKRIQEVEKISVNHPKIKNVHADVCEKMRTLLFIETDKSAKKLQDLDDLVANQKTFFAYADECYPVIEEVVKSNDYTGKLDEIGQARYVNGLWEYFLKDMLEASTGETKAVLDKEAFKNKLAERISDESKRESLLVVDNRVSNLDFEKINDVSGGLTQKDLERAIVTGGNTRLIKQYNELSIQQRKLFALALYSYKKEERGTMRVIFGQRKDDISSTREQIQKYMKGEDVDFKVDFAKAIRAVTVKGKGYKYESDAELFNDALDFVNKIEIRKERLRPKQWDRMSDSSNIIELADQMRGEVGKSINNYEKQADVIKRCQCTDLNGFLKALNNVMETDKRRQTDNALLINMGPGIKKIMDRLSKLSEGQKNLVIYALQDRTVLDLSTGGKDEDSKVTPHANVDKRFSIYEELITEEGRLKAVKSASDPSALMRAMKSLFSFQVRDDKELTSSELTEKDFADGALKRVEAIDWNLLGNAIDFIDEIENERIRVKAVRMAERLIEDPKNINKDKSTQYYHDQVNRFGNISNEQKEEVFESLITGAFIKDEEAFRLGKMFEGDTEHEDILIGFKSLTPQQKNLFFRALEHRDILDVSQQNLYRNVLGLADRNYVNPKGRDALIEEFLNNNGTIEVDTECYRKAFRSLCSRQINDDMDFSDPETLSDVKKNLYVNNQYFVMDRNTVIDWKLFKRALQFVTKTVNERKLATGDEALYKSLGDQTNGEMKIDRKYLRMNLHHTGYRFMRFLAKEGYGMAEDYLGYLDTAAGFADYVLGEKTSNFIHEKINLVKADEKEEEKEKEEKIELEVEQKKSADEIAKEKEEEEKKEKEKKDKEEKDNKLKELEKNYKKQQEEIAKILEQKKLEETRIKNGEVIPEDQKVKMIDEKDIIKLTDEQKKDLAKIHKQEERDARKMYREENDYHNILGSIKAVADNYEKQKKALKQISDTAKDTYKTYKKLFTGEEEDQDEDVADNLDIELKDVKYKRKEQGLTTNDKVNALISYGGLAMDIKEKLDTYLLDPENVAKFEGYMQSYLFGIISYQGIADVYDKVEFKLQKIDGSVHDFLMPDWLKGALDTALDKYSKTTDFLNNVAAYVGEAGEILGVFANTVEAAMNIRKLNKTANEAKKSHDEDTGKVQALDEIKFDKTLIENAAANNLSLMQVGNDFTKSIEGRLIMQNAGKVASRIAYYAGRGEDIGAAISGAVKLASFIWQCMSDNKTVYQYYSKGGNLVLANLMRGWNKFEETNAGKKYLSNKKKPGVNENGQYEVNGRAFDLLRDGQGFERDEELSDFLKLNMVHSLLFSSSKFNPLKESKILAECTLAVLGLDDVIGKSDSETAMKVFNKLKQ